MRQTPEVLRTSFDDEVRVEKYVQSRPTRAAVA